MGIGWKGKGGRNRKNMWGLLERGVVRRCGFLSVFVISVVVTWGMEREEKGEKGEGKGTKEEKGKSFGSRCCC